MVGEDIPEGSYHQRRAFEPFQLPSDACDVLLKSEKFALRVTFLVLGVLKVLHEMNVPVFQGDDLSLQFLYFGVLGHIKRHHNRFHLKIAYPNILDSG